MRKLAALLAIVATVGLIAAVAQLGGTTSAGPTNKVYWTDFAADKIQRANLDGSTVEDLVTTGIDGPGLITIDTGAGKLYWADFNAAAIRRSNLNGSSVEGLVTTGLTAPFGVALDLDNNKLYWTDFSAQRIQRSNLDGSSVENLITTNISAPIGIAIGGSKMYFVDSGAARIQRANLNGSGVQTLVTGLSLPGGIALDLIAGKMYWTEFGTNERIARANLDGTSVQTLVTAGLQGPLGIALDIGAGKMYWADDTTNKIQRANLDGTSVEDLVTAGLNDPTGITLDVPVPPTPTPTATNTPTNTPTSTPTPTLTPTPTPFPTSKATATPKATPTVNPSASGSLRLDADCESPLGPPLDTSVQKQRYVLVGATIHVCVFGTFPSPGSAAGYRVRVHWDEASLDLVPRTQVANDIWHQLLPGAGGPPNAAVPVQSLGGWPDDGIGSDSYVLLSTQDAQNVNNTSVIYNGPVAQFEFTCQTHAAGNIELRLPGVSGGTVLFNGVTETKPTLSNIVIRCVSPSLDNDVDGCTNDKELGTNPEVGGLRDPDYFWDFYDVWTHPGGDLSLWSKSSNVDLFGDIFGVAFRFGESGSPAGDPFVPPLNETGYHVAFDRSPPALGGDVWDAGPADGTIDLFNDIFGVAFQFGHSCI